MKRQAPLEDTSIACVLVWGSLLAHYSASKFPRRQQTKSLSELRGRFMAWKNKSRRPYSRLEALDYRLEETREISDKLSPHLDRILMILRSLYGMQEPEPLQYIQQLPGREDSTFVAPPLVKHSKDSPESLCTKLSKQIRALEMSEPDYQSFVFDAQRTGFKQWADGRQSEKVCAGRKYRESDAVRFRQGWKQLETGSGETNLSNEQYVEFITRHWHFYRSRNLEDSGISSSWITKVSSAFEKACKDRIFAILFMLLKKSVSGKPR